MSMASTMPATAASTAAPVAIPFRHEAGGSASGGVSILVAACLLGAAFVALWLLKRRGWQGMHGQVSARANTGVVVAQRLRLSTGCAAYVLQDGNDRLLVIEARSGVQTMPLRGVATEHGEGAEA
jgi:hypothetical protein